MRFTHQNHPDARVELHQASQGPQRFRDALIRLEITEGADQRRGFVEAQQCAGGVAIRVRESTRRAEWWRSDR